MPSGVDSVASDRRAEALRSAIDQLSAFDPRRPRGLEFLVTPMAELMGFSFSLAYRPVATVHGPHIAETFGTGIVAARAQRAIAAGDIDVAKLQRPARGITVTPVRSAGETGHALVTLDAGRERTAYRLARCTPRWRLSRRQAEVLALVIDGLTNATIAAELGIGLRAVERHVASVRRRARVDTRAALIRAVWHDA